MLFHKKPIDYITEMEVAACIIEHEWEVLLVQRCKDTKFWGTWQEPGGKIDTGEDHESAMIREVFEETWIVLKVWETQKLFKQYFCFDDMNIAITFYHTTLIEKPNIILAPNEHSDYKWVIPRDALKMNLIEDFDLVLKEIYDI